MQGISIAHFHVNCEQSPEPYLTILAQVEIQSHQYYIYCKLGFHTQ